MILKKFWIGVLPDDICHYDSYSKFWPGDHLLIQ